jgi:hypothetical protein
MLHDCRGSLLSVGDDVILRAKVTSVSPGEQFCNCTVEATEKPEGECPTVVTCNSKFFEKVIIQKTAPALGEQVKIKATGVTGEVIGIWHSKYDQTRYNVRWACQADTTIHERWMAIDELELL